MLTDYKTETQGVPVDYNKLIETLSYKTQTPYNNILLDVFSERTSKLISNYTIEEIKEAKKGLDIPKMRRISRFYYESSSFYKRLILFFSQLYKYYYTLDFKGLSNYLQPTNKDRILRLYNKTLNFLDNSDIETTFSFIASQVLIEGVYYGLVSYTDDSHLVISQLETGYCRSRYKTAYNTEIVEFNVTFFNRFKNEKDRQEALSAFPLEIQRAYALLRQGNLSPENYFVQIPPQYACCFSFNQTFIPPLYDSILDDFNFEESMNIEKARNSQTLQKLLVQRFNLDEQGDMNVLLQELGDIHKAVSDLFKTNPYVDVMTTFADEVKLENTQVKTSNTNDKVVQNLLLARYSGAGISSELFASTSANSLKLSINNATSFMSQLIDSFGNWLSVICLSKFPFSGIIPMVTILPVTWYNESAMNDMYMKNAQSGFSWILPYVASGKKQSTIADSKSLENDLLGLQDKIIPLQISSTQSGSTGGREELPIEEKSQKTIENTN